METPATKVIYLARRNPALSAEAFPGRWRQHSLLAGSVPAIRPGFAQVAQCVNLYDRAIVPRAALGYDGVNLLTLTDAAFARSMWQADEVHDVVLADELETFSTYVRHFSITTEEYLVRDAPMRPFCLITFLRRDRPVELGTFGEALIEACRDAVTGRRWVVNIVIDRQPGYNFDAVTEAWFDSLDDAALVTASPAYRAYISRRHALCDEGRSVAMMTRVNYARPAIDG